MDIKSLIQEGKRERETGNLSRALEIFLTIDKTQLTRTQAYDYLGELGLTYFHLNDFKQAQHIFETGLNNSKKDQEISYEALFLRHLAKPQFKYKNSQILKMALRAHKLAVESGRKDIVWFDQGVISALININSKYEDLKKWFEIEANDLYIASKSIKDETALWVWVTGMLIEKFNYDQDKSHLYLALILAEKFSLARRKEQILEILNL